MILANGSMLIIEALAKAGGDIFIGYPITPANSLYQYGIQRFPMSLAAPDEITTLQWMAGFSATGKLPVTATSFPGLALMIESINMAYMMELPMVIALVQRFGPSTGTATCGAQGDLLLINGLISGGYPVPTFCISSMDDCWDISASAASAAVELRTPVFLLTSKEMVMPLRGYDISSLSEIDPVSYSYHDDDRKYVPYEPGNNLVPGFLPVGNERHQTRLTASTHGRHGILQHTTKEALANTTRLQEKILKNLPEFTFHELDEEDADTAIVSFGITSPAARRAVRTLRKNGVSVSHLIAKTLFPVPPLYIDTIRNYRRVVVAEENQNGQFRQILFGVSGREGVTGVNTIGRMITPEEIIEEVTGDGR